MFILLFSIQKTWTISSSSIKVEELAYYLLSMVINQAILLSLYGEFRKLSTTEVVIFRSISQQGEAIANTYKFYIFVHFSKFFPRYFPNIFVDRMASLPRFVSQRGRAWEARGVPSSWIFRENMCLAGFTDISQYSTIITKC